MAVDLGTGAVDSVGISCGGGAVRGRCIRSESVRRRCGWREWGIFQSNGWSVCGCVLFLRQPFR